MPKGNPGRLKSRFEISGELTPNEYEFQQHHGEMTEQEHENFPPAEGQEAEASLSPQEREAARIAEVEAHAHEIVERRRAQQSKPASSSAKGSKGKAAQKSAGKKKKSAAKRSGSAAKSRGAKKSATKSATKTATKKASGKTSTKKSGKKSAGKSAKKGSSKKSAKRR